MTACLSHRFLKVKKLLSDKVPDFRLHLGSLPLPLKLILKNYTNFVSVNDRTLLLIAYSCFKSLKSLFEKSVIKKDPTEVF